MHSHSRLPLTLLLASALMPGCRFGYEKILEQGPDDSQTLTRSGSGSSANGDGGATSDGGSSLSLGGASAGGGTESGGGGGITTTAVGGGTTHCNIADEKSYFLDEDGDGFGSPTNSLSACSAPSGFVEDNTDCADEAVASPTCNGLPGELCHPGPSANDGCDGADNDCDGVTDEDCPVSNPSGLILWLDADDPASLSIGSGITQWRDKSLLGNHVSAAAASAQPIALSGVHPTRQVIQFDGVNDALIGDNADGDFDAENFHLYVVLSAAWRVEPPGNPSPFAVRGEDAEQTRFSLHVDKGLTSVHSFNGSNQYFGSTDIALDQFYLLEVSVGPGGISHYNDGVLLNTDAGFTLGEELNLPLRIGSAEEDTEFFEGSVAEVLMFNRELSDFERAALAAFLLNKWQIVTF